MHKHKNLFAKPRPFAFGIANILNFLILVILLILVFPLSLFSQDSSPASSDNGQAVEVSLNNADAVQDNVGNNAATGRPTISGAAQVGRTLTQSGSSVSGDYTLTLGLPLGAELKDALHMRMHPHSPLGGYDAKVSFVV